MEKEKAEPMTSTTPGNNSQRSNRRRRLLLTPFLAMIPLSAWKLSRMRVSSYYRPVMMTAEKEKVNLLNTSKMIQQQQQEEEIVIPTNTTSIDDLLPIRSWGCQRRSEAPMIFVHLGKAGGGNVRARISASALDYDPAIWDRVPKETSHYYPIPSSSDDNEDNTTIYYNKGKFLNSAMPHFRPMYPPLNNATALLSQQNDQQQNEMMRLADKRWKSFEGTLPCAGKTPLGRALACAHVPVSLSQHANYCNYLNGARCDIVYVGHNNLGSEWHWLPNQYLQQWWKNTPWYQQSDGDDDDDDSILQLLQQRSQKWMIPEEEGMASTNSSSNSSSTSRSPCVFQPRSSQANDSLVRAARRFYKQNYYSCVAPEEETADQEVIRAVAQATASASSANGMITDWSILHASLPLLRIVLLREPFSWLVSKYFWHWRSPGYLTMGSGRGNVLVEKCDGHFQKDNHQTTTTIMDYSSWKNLTEWASATARTYLFFLCGEDCMARQMTMSVVDLERQAANNLRQSFAVVGLLQETDTFYDMITARISYMNMSLNPNVKERNHKSGGGAEHERCRHVYQNPDFQKTLLKQCPELAALQRVYNVGVQVNQAQKKELQDCGFTL